MSENIQPLAAPIRATISLKSILLFFAGALAGLLIGYFVFAANSQDDRRIGYSASTNAVTVAPTVDSVVSADPVTSLDPPAASPVPHKTFDVATVIGTLPTENESAYLSYMKARSTETEQHLKARWDLSVMLRGTKELEGPAIEGFLRTPREDFVRSFNMARAYDNTWLPIGFGATITDPAVVSMMTTTLAVSPKDKVLEIGTGSGYQSAILSNMSNNVYSIEIIEPLQKETDALYNTLSARYPQYGNIHRKLGDGYYGWEENAPFDRIIVTCAIDHLPPPLLRQLSPGGIMVVPMGPPGRQHLMEVKKIVEPDGTISLQRRDVYNGLTVKFIPFRDDKGTSYSNTKS